MALVLTGVIGVAWGRAQQVSRAPVDASLTVFAQGQDCSKFHASGDCPTMNALYAVRADTGAVRWEGVTPKTNGFNGAPLFHDGVVYIYSYPGSPPIVGDMGNYVLTAWSGRSGAQLWQAQVLSGGAEEPATSVTNDQLVVVNGQLFNPDNTAPDAYEQPLLTMLRLRASDGGLLGKARLSAGGYPTIVDDTAYQCPPNGPIIATRVSDGAQLWRSPTSGAAARFVMSLCAVTVTDGVVFAELSSVGGGGGGARPIGHLLAMNASTGQVLWSYATPTPNPLAVDDGLVVVGEGSPYAPTSIVALRISDGSVAWRHTGFPAPPPFRGLSFGYSNVAIGAGLVLVGEGSTLWALRVSTGKTAWQKTSDGHLLQTIGSAHNTIFIRATSAGLSLALLTGGSDSYLAALRASDGSTYWQTSLDMQGSGSPIMGDV